MIKCEFIPNDKEFLAKPNAFQYTHTIRVTQIEEQIQQVSEWFVLVKDRVLLEWDCVAVSELSTRNRVLSLAWEKREGKAVVHFLKQQGIIDKVEDYVQNSIDVLEQA